MKFDETIIFPTRILATLTPRFPKQIYDNSPSENV